MTIRQRIQDRIDALGPKVSPRSVSLGAGLSTHFLQNYLSGKTRSMTVEKLIDIAKELGVRAEWLISGRGPMNEEDLLISPDVVDIWSRIPERDRASAKRMLQGLARASGSDEE